MMRPYRQVMCVDGQVVWSVDGKLYSYVGPGRSVWRCLGPATYWTGKAPSRLARLIGPK